MPQLALEAFRVGDLRAEASRICGFFKAVPSKKLLAMSAEGKFSASRPYKPPRPKLAESLPVASLGPKARQAALSSNGQAIYVCYPRCPLRFRWGVLRHLDVLVRRRTALHSPAREGLSGLEALLLLFVVLPCCWLSEAA